jgi:hypothetical protein
VPDALWDELTPMIAEYNATHGAFQDTRDNRPKGH